MEAWRAGFHFFELEGCVLQKRRLKRLHQLPILLNRGVVQWQSSVQPLRKRAKRVPLYHIMHLSHYSVVKQNVWRLTSSQKDAVNAGEISGEISRTQVELTVWHLKAS